MTYEEFRNTLTGSTPPANISRLLESLWEDAKGNWERAHTLAQKEATVHGARVHAYLHRKEGDSSNADYWYNRAGTTMTPMTLDAEWELLVREFLLK